MLLDKNAILDADDLPFQDVEIPEWKGSVRVKTMTGKERDEFEMSVMDAKIGNKVDLRGLKAKLISLCAVNESGERLFTEAEVATLNKKSAKALDALFKAAQQLNGIGVGEMESLRKN